ncbi:MAG: hypothetical protein H6686_10445 [Fibrobacteria bacterium]|nr:hypothetical protein [Fibrobacteria bacterium]
MRFWLSRRAPTWDRIPALLGGLLLLSELSPLPIFSLDLASARVLIQFPLVAVVLLSTLERRFLLTLVAAAFLAACQSFHGIHFGLQGLWSLETLVAPIGWSLWFGSLLIPARRMLHFPASTEGVDSPSR